MIIRKTLREQVVEILRHKILSGEIKPGERIIEAKVAEELKVSRGPLREALRQIEEEGLVVYEAQKGCVVKTMTYKEMQETYLIQSTLEKLAVQMCGGEISKEQDEEMQKLVLSMEKAANQKNLYEVIEFDEQFHECIVKTAHSENFIESGKYWKEGIRRHIIRWIQKLWYHLMWSTSIIREFWICFIKGQSKISVKR